MLLRIGLIMALLFLSVAARSDGIGGRSAVVGVDGISALGAAVGGASGIGESCCLRRQLAVVT